MCQGAAEFMPSPVKAPSEARRGKVARSAGSGVFVFVSADGSE